MPTNSSPEYMREWRKTESGKRAGERQKVMQNATQAAYRELAQRHVAEFEALKDKCLRTKLREWAEKQARLTTSE